MAPPKEIDEEVFELGQGLRRWPLVLPLRIFFTAYFKGFFGVWRFETESGDFGSVCGLGNALAAGLDVASVGAGVCVGGRE